MKKINNHDWVTITATIIAAIVVIAVIAAIIIMVVNGQRVESDDAAKIASYNAVRAVGLLP